MMHHYYRSAFVVLLINLLIIVTSCSTNDNPADDSMLKGKISSYNEFGGAMLDFTSSDMTNAGFTLGDVISITIDSIELVMPYYDGYYGRKGEYVCVAYPTYPSICFNINMDKLPSELMGLEGHSVTVRMVKKGGCLDVQQAMSMEYTNNRSDYPNLTDAEFSNSRTVNAGNIAKGMLYRSSSPFCNDINRAYDVSDYLESEGVMTVLNLSDTKEKMLNYDMPPYSRTLWDTGNVILCPLMADPMADDYNRKLIAALNELAQRPGPYVVHCVEGKDRTGYVCALLEGLCGATYDEIVADYLTTYFNYYRITPDNNPDVCSVLVSIKLNPCLMYYAGITDESELKDVDFSKAFSNYLLSHGMTPQQLQALIQSLTSACQGTVP